MPPKIPDISSTLTELCERLVPANPKPILVPVEIMPRAVERGCFPNVELKIKMEGGSMQTGWKIFETLPAVLLEAEFHAVWVDPSGHYHDITPPGFEAEKILFLPDANRPYEGRQVNSERVALRDDQLIADYIKNENLIFIATNAGDLANQHGVVMIDSRLAEQRISLGAAIYEKYFLK